MSTVSESADEDKNLPTANNNPSAFAESTGDPDVSNSSHQSLTPAQTLKATISFRALVESDDRKLKASGARWLCCCPFHPDRTPSFVIDEDDDRATCYGCGWYGDIFKYVMDRTGCGFGAAFHHLRQAPTLHDTKTKRVPKKSQGHAEEYKFTERELQEIDQSTSKILNDSERCARIAGGRNWKPETIRRLAASRHLGWGGDALNFIYKTGIKVREWPGKRFYWWAGTPHIWRADMLAKAGVVFLTEGEPDAITLIDVGFEAEAGTVVVAAPSASTFSASWVEMFRGKRVTICFDADDAGRKGLNRVGPMLQSVNARLRQWTVKEVA